MESFTRAMCSQYIIFFIFLNVIANKIPITTTKYGQILGTILRTQEGREFYAFLGIPYAAPPLEEKRFQPPEVLTPWKGIRDYSTEGSLCLQRDRFSGDVVGSEDCLSLNVYTPWLPHDPKSTPLPVMVFFHGGAFNFGVSTPTFRGPGRLLERDVVLIVINYRLGPLGFLSTNDESAPGNYGMLDQVMALRWIQDNIEGFGGNPKLVTLFGDSAGGASVLYHVLSPLSNGLFHKGIAMSGSPLCPWALQESPSQWAKRLASDVGCPLKNSFHIVNCLRNISSTILVEKSDSYFKFSFLPIAFAPVIDSSRGSSAFLPQHPRLLFRNGVLNPASIMMGITKEEGAFVYAEIMSENQTLLSSKNEIEDVIINAMDEDLMEKFDSETLQVKYFGNTDYKNHKDIRPKIISFLTDCLFRACHFETALLLLKNKIKPFLFTHDYKPETFTVTQFFGIKEFIGVGHVDYLPFLFDGNVFGYHILSGRDLAISQLLTKLWTSFSAFESPTPFQSPIDWQAATPKQIKILRIDQPLEIVEFADVADERLNWWLSTIMEKINDEL